MHASACAECHKQHVLTSLRVFCTWKLFNPQCQTNNKICTPTALTCKLNCMKHDQRKTQVQNQTVSSNSTVNKQACMNVKANCIHWNILRCCTRLECACKYHCFNSSRVSSSYQPFQIHICWNVSNQERIDPPVHTEYLRSGDDDFDLDGEGVKAASSGDVRSPLPANMVATRKHDDHEAACPVTEALLHRAWWV